MSRHFDIQPFLKVLLTFLIEGVVCGFNFDMPFDWNISHLEQLSSALRAVLLFEYPIETAAPFVFGMKVFSVNPAITFVAMAPFSPTPQRLIHLIVEVDEALFTDHVSVEVGPATEDGVQFGDELTSR